MYSTNIRGNRCLIDCVIALTEVSLEKFVVDTGAMFTCCSYNIVDGRLKEKELEGSEVKLIGGFVEGEYLKFYNLPLRQFTIGNIDMGEQDIWITFDEKITDIILGMDILRQIIMIKNPYDQCIYFCKDADDYEQNFRLKVG